MMTAGEDDGAKGFLERILYSPGAMATILVALTGQVWAAIFFQIINNQEQTADIERNLVAITTLRSEIVNLQTPLSTLVLKMEGRLSTIEGDHKTMESRLSSSDVATNVRIESMDRGGTRALELVSDNQKRVLATIERIQDRMMSFDQRLNDVQNRSVLQLQNQIDLINQNLKRIDEQQTRIIQALDNQYNTLTELIRQLVPKQVPPGPMPGTRR